MELIWRGFWNFNAYIILFSIYFSSNGKPNTVAGCQLDYFLESGQLWGNMSNLQRLKELEIRGLTPDLLGPISAKVIIDKAYYKLFDILDEITNLINNEELIPKSLI